MVIFVGFPSIGQLDLLWVHSYSTGILEPIHILVLRIYNRNFIYLRKLRICTLNCKYLLRVIIQCPTLLANPRSPFVGKGSMHPFIHLSIGFWLYTALQCRSSMSSNCLVFHTSGGISSSPAAFLFLIFLRTESSSSCVNGPSLMSNCLLIILVIGSCVIFGGFPSKFSKCCFHSFILSCWFAALSFALALSFASFFCSLRLLFARLS